LLIDRQKYPDEISGLEDSCLQNIAINESKSQATIALGQSPQLPEKTFRQIDAKEKAGEMTEGRRCEQSQLTKSRNRLETLIGQAG